MYQSKIALLYYTIREIVHFPITTHLKYYILKYYKIFFVNIICYACTVCQDSVTVGAGMFTRFLMLIIVILTTVIPNSSRS